MINKKMLYSDIIVNNDNFLGAGLYGSCHLTTDGNVFKRFNSSEPEYYVNYLSKITGIKNDLYVMPSKIVCDSRGRAVGVLMPYIDSSNLSLKAVNIDDLYSQIDNIYLYTDELSKHGISSFDIRKENILYTTTFKIIDTDMYQKQAKKSSMMYDYIRDNNIRQINFGMLDVIGLGLGCKKRDLYKIVVNNYDLNELYKQLLESNDNRVLKEFFVLLKEKVSVYSNALVDTKDYYKFKL